jgi:hypothetical protein
MTNTTRLILLAAATALALPAAAGSWPPTPPRKAHAVAQSVPSAAQVPVGTPRAVADFEQVGGDAGWQPAQHKYVYVEGKWVHSDECDHAVRARAVTVAPQRAIDGFEPAGGDAGWQPSQHKYIFANGKFTMSDECDHAIRTVQRPTPAELESDRRLYSGG